jgi:uncharacterized membrane protein
MPTAGEARVHGVETRIASMLTVGALIAVTLLIAGVGLMLAAGISPDSTTFPAFDPAPIVADLVALRPEGFLWMGILVVIATPVVRVSAEALGFFRAGEPWLALVAVLILGVIASSVVLAGLLEGLTGGSPA